MIDKEKVAVMTKLAIYEQHEGKEDMALMDYFMLDFISLNNLKVQLSVTLALILIFGAHALDIALENMSRITELDFVGLGKGYLKVWIIVIVGYTIISSLYSFFEYRKSRKRINEYKTLLNKLGKLEKR